MRAYIKVCKSVGITASNNNESFSPDVRRMRWSPIFRHHVTLKCSVTNASLQKTEDMYSIRLNYYIRLMTRRQGIRGDIGKKKLASHVILCRRTAHVHGIG